MTITTDVNPGAFKVRRKRSIRNFLSVLFRKLKKGQPTEAANFALTESVNMVNERFRTKAEPRFLCSICNEASPFFTHLSNRLRVSWNSSCPHCDSRSRHRGLFFLYRDTIATVEKEYNILHIAPEPVFFGLFKNKKNIVYHTSDYFLKDVDFPHEDIQNLSFPNDHYDLILCNHVIEHVPDDDSAFKEVNRVLKANGKAIITIPGNYKGNETVYFNNLDINGHYRDYGMGVAEKMRKYFAKVDPVNLLEYVSKKERLNFSIAANEIAFVCEKKS